MHAAHRAVAVIAGDGVMAADDFFETLDKLRQLGRRNSGIFDKGDGLLITFGAEQ